ncbi:MAG: DMT family transporter [Proteobacteria bacterium]|nr:DMT family transporter [Pseudomonadota bacterium]
MQAGRDWARKPRGTIVAGVASGTGAALFWAIGFVAARHGIDAGFSPADLALHRFVWPGLAFLPLLLLRATPEFGAIGWGRALALTCCGGPPLALISYYGFLLVPLGHAGVIQPSCAALGGLAMATLVLGERLPRRRLFGALAIVGGLVIIGGESLSSFGSHGLLGDFAFMLAGFLFSIFGILLRQWRIGPIAATFAVSALALGFVPLHAAFFGFGHIVALGLWENMAQALAQGVLAGAGAIYLFARAVMLLGAGRAAVFPSLVPGFTLLIGFIVLGEVPSLTQLAGLVVVMAGFRLTQRV